MPSGTYKNCVGAWIFQAFRPLGTWARASSQ